MYTETLEKLMQRANGEFKSTMTVPALVALAYKSGDHDGWYRAKEEVEHFKQLHKEAAEAWESAGDELLEERKKCASLEVENTKLESQLKDCAFIHKQDAKNIRELQEKLRFCKQRFLEISKLKTVGKFLPNMSKDMIEYIEKK